MNLRQFTKMGRFRFLASVFVAILAVCVCSTANAADPMPSWNDGTAKKTILEFVAAVTNEGGKYYVASAERIAVFDNDGTLWVEQPM